MEGSSTNHNQQGDRIVQNENNPILESLSPFCDNHLFDAILNGELENVKRCIESEALVNQVSKGTGTTALHLAVACGNVTIVKLLLARGADVRRRDGDGREAVHVAAALCNLEMLGLLIRYSCDINSVVAADTSELTFELFNMVYPNHNIAMKKIPIMEIGDTPLSLAANINHKEGVILLIERGAKIILDDAIDYNASFSKNKVLARYIIYMLKDRVGSRPSTTPVVIRGGKEFKLSITCLHEAIEQEDLPLIDFLVDFDPCQLILEKDGSFPLHRLVLKKLLKPLENVLVKRNEPQILEAKDMLKCTPLYLAVLYGWLPGVKALLKAGADVTVYPKGGETVLHVAAESGRLEILEELLKSFKSVEIRDVQDSQGRTPLYIAVHHQWLPGVIALLKAGADVTIYPNDRKTVLHLAAAFSQHEILEELLKSSKSGEILNMLNDRQETPLCSAVRAGQRHNVELLIYKGADPYFKLPRDRTLLHLAAELGQPDILDAVIRRRLYSDEIINYSDANGLTALHFAALHGSHSCVNVLISYGCDVDKKTKDQNFSGSTPLHLAAWKGHNEVVEQIIRRKKDTLNITDANNYIPLQIAAMYNNKECLRFMLHNGADIGATVTDEFGDKMTALELIVSNVDNAAEFLTETFDQCIIEEMDQERLKKSTITVKFDLFRPSSYGNQLRVLESFLNCENEDVEENLLLHPVVETCLYVKWRKFMFFFFVMIVLQLTYTVSLTVMVMSLYTTESQTKFVNNSVFICRCTMSSSLLLIILLELLQASRMQRYHFKDPESRVKWTMILLSLLVLVGDHPADGLVGVSAVAVLLSWIELLFQMSRWHSFPGLYVLMFFAVAKNVLKVLATFFCVILGYVFAFIIYFRAKGPFRDWPTSFYKVMVMMNDLDYESVFDDFREQDVLVGRGIFLSFMLLVAIVLMNLLTGLAVDDIQELKKKGKAKCLAKQIGFFCMLELFVNSLCNSPYCPNIIVKLIEPWKKIDYELQIEPGNNKSHIKKSLKASLRNIILKQKRKSKEATKGEN